MARAATVYLDPVVVAAYVAHYPQLEALARRLPERQSVKTFGINANVLERPPGVTPEQVGELTKHCTKLQLRMRRRTPEDRPWRPFP